MDQLAKLGPFAALGKLWNDLSPSQRVLAIAFVVLSVAVVGFATVIASKPRMSVLFSGLETEDAGAIVQKLDEEKVPYQLSGDGRTIEVPANQSYDLRLKMATQGLPQGGTVGFEQFDKSNFGMTEFTERVTYQRALQGELTRTICQLAPVVSARVMIAIPEDKVYESEQTEPTASIFLKLRRGDPLTDEQVGGIVHLVSSAVEGLKPSSVTVVDSQGNVLSGLYAEGAAAGGMSMTQSKIKRQYETELAANLQSMLARIVGADKAVVRVSAELDFNQHRESSETYEPAGTTSQDEPEHGVLASQEMSNETYNGGSSTPPTTNPTVAVSTGDASGKKHEYELKRSTAEYHVSKTTQETVAAPGKVSRLSVAVLVDQSVAGNKIATIRDAVTAAAGINPARKDQVTVQSVAFDTTTKKSMEKEMAGAEKSGMIMGILKNAGPVVLLLMFLFFLRSIVRQIKVQAPTGPAISPFAGASTPGGTMPPNPVEMMREVSGADAAAQAPVKRSPNSNLPPEVAQSSPEDLARLVKAWMSEAS